jgi:hypothetical protein
MLPALGQTVQLIKDLPNAIIRLRMP